MNRNGRNPLDLWKSNLMNGMSMFVAALISTSFAYLLQNSGIYRINAPVPANWTHYRNDPYGFEFEYPREWELHATKGADSPLTIELGVNPHKLDGIWITLPLPPEPVAQKVAAYKTSDDFVSAGPFVAPHLQGMRVVMRDNLHKRDNDVFWFNKPGTNLLFSAAVVNEEKPPQMDSTLRTLLASFTFY